MIEKEKLCLFISLHWDFDFGSILREHRIKAEVWCDYKLQIDADCDRCWNAKRPIWCLKIILIECFSQLGWKHWAFRHWNLDIIRQKKNVSWNDSANRQFCLQINSILIENVCCRSEQNHLSWNSPLSFLFSLFILFSPRLTTPFSSVPLVSRCCAWLEHRIASAKSVELNLNGKMRSIDFVCVCLQSKSIDKSVFPSCNDPDSVI